MNEQPLQLPAPAKLNLFLHITGRRDDAYHELQTVFQLLDYGDSLSFSPAEQLSLSCNEAALEGPDNLILRAAALLQPWNRQQSGCHIHLDKKLPMGGGVGGGSSDAATTLVALNRLWQCGLENQQLMEIGGTLGADIPVFIQGHSAWAQGIGEKLQNLTLPERWYLVICPPCGAATIEIFSHPELTRNSAPIRIPAFPFPGTRNDCQTVAILLHPEIKQALNWLADFSEARMTGTGSSVFAAFDSEARARDVLAQLPTQFRGFVARGVNQSPLYHALRLYQMLK